MDTMLRTLAWVDYRFAVLLTVLLPLGLLVWALVRGSGAIAHLLTIYWRVASLLAISVYLLVPGWGVGYLTGVLARILIPVSLWFWADLNEEIDDQPERALKLAFTSWRWATSFYCVAGAILTLPFIPCTVGGATAYCELWREAPVRYAQLLHPNQTPGFLGFLGATGLFFYTLYFLYFLVFRLTKQGRTAMEQ